MTAINFAPDAAGVASTIGNAYCDYCRKRSVGVVFHNESARFYCDECGMADLLHSGPVYVALTLCARCGEALTSHGVTADSAVGGVWLVAHHHYDESHTDATLIELNPVNVISTGGAS